MWFAIVLSAIIVLAILIDEDVLRILYCEYWSSDTKRIILLVGKYELAYWHSNNTGYRALVLCVWRLHIGYYSLVNRPYEDTDEKPKFTIHFGIFEGKLFDLDWAYGLLRIGAGITRIHAFYVEVADSTTWPHETEPESTVNIKHLRSMKEQYDVTEE